MNNDKIFNIPSKEILRAWVQWLAIVLTTFLGIYMFTNSYAANQLEHYHLYAEWELLIPLVPPMILIYMSYVLIFVVVLFVAKTPSAIKGLAVSMLVAIIISGVIFMVFPGHLGYQREAFVPGYDLLYKFLFFIDKPHNLFPSLHIAFASLTVMMMTQQTQNTIFHLSLKVWFVLVCASVIFTHQHHFFDIGLAMVMGAVIYKIVYIRVLQSGAISQKSTVTNLQSDRLPK